MRQLFVIVPRGKGAEATRISSDHGGANQAWFEAAGQDQDWDAVITHLPNDQVGPVIGKLQEIEKAHFSFFPHGVIALKPPAGKAPDEVGDVDHRSPLEIVLGGIQSVGSWKGFLTYAIAAGIVAWVGLYLNLGYLLTASMLIAPFAGPAINLALATARGDSRLVRRTALRYFASLAAAIGSAAGMAGLVQQKTATESMIQLSQVSSVSILLPLLAGAVGALHLCQSERKSLVTAAGTGVLVAASISPPGAILGSCLVLQEWGMVKNSAFLLVLQLAGITFSGALVFAYFGLSPEGVRFARGQTWVRWALFGVMGLGLSGMLVWQFWGSWPALQRASISQNLNGEIKQVINRSGLARVVEVNTRFTRADVPGHPFLVVAYVQKQPGLAVPDAEVKSRLTQAVQGFCRSTEPRLTPLVEVTVLTP